MNKITNAQPLVSVIMPVYNAGGFLVPAIDSILKQSYKNFEFIIVNDNSSDGSLKVIKRFQKRFPKKIMVINLAKTMNRGGDACANEGLKKAKGKYIARMDADDIAHPKRLEKQVRFLEKNPEYFLVGANAWVIDKYGKIIGKKEEPISTKDIYAAYFTFHPIIHPTAMYRRKIGKEPFFYPKKFSANNDYYVFFKMLCLGFKYANLKEKLLYYRIHGKNDTFQDVKEKFLNTLKTRYLMFIKYHYHPTVKQVFITIAQSIIIFILPTALVTRLYFFSKGIGKKRQFAI